MYKSLVQTDVFEDINLNPDFDLDSYTCNIFSLGVINIIKFRLETSYGRGQRSHILSCYFCLSKTNFMGNLAILRLILEFISDIYMIDNVLNNLYRAQFH